MPWALLYEKSYSQSSMRRSRKVAADRILGAFLVNKGDMSSFLRSSVAFTQRIDEVIHILYTA
jgi:hypothetical protein